MLVRMQRERALHTAVSVSRCRPGLFAEIKPRRRVKGLRGLFFHAAVNHRQARAGTKAGAEAGTTESCLMACSWPTLSHLHYAPLAHLPRGALTHRAWILSQ